MQTFFTVACVAGVQPEQTCAYQNPFPAGDMAGATCVEGYILCSHFDLCRGWIDKRALLQRRGIGISGIDPDTPPLNLQSASGKEPDGVRIEAMFLLQNSGTQALFSVIVKNRNHRLRNDGSCIHPGINEVYGASGKSGTVFQGLFLHIQAGESREQSGMDIHNAMRKSIHKVCAHDAHEPGKNHEFHSILFELRDNRAVKRRAGGEITVVDTAVGDTGIPGTL
jgi:hypothetical protein